MIDPKNNPFNVRFSNPEVESIRVDIARYINTNLVCLDAADICYNIRFRINVSFPLVDKFGKGVAMGILLNLGRRSSPRQRL